MKFRIVKNDVLNYVYSTIAFIFTYWFISIYNIVMAAPLDANTYSFGTHLLYTFLNDFWSGLIIGLLCFPLYLICVGISKKVATSVLFIIFSLLIILQFSLVKYSLTTLINLGADILGYSFNDAYNTVASSESISFVYFLPFVILPAAFIVLYILLKKYSNSKVIVWGAMASVVVFVGLRFILPGITSEEFQNKTAYLATDIIKLQIDKNKLSAINFSEREDYPLLKSFNAPDVLSPYFNKNKDKPNVVVIVVEGLGGEFVDKNNYSGFMPYVDSLINKSLYWENFLSTTGRSFGVLPSLFGSLPYGETGFLEIKDTPAHQSLISILKANGYYTSFYSGDASSFDRKINFLEYNGIDYIVDENKFGSEYTKTKANDGGFSWGYPDGEIFKKTLQSLNPEKQPRLDIVMTLTNHEPFQYPNKERYMDQVDRILNASTKTDDLKNKIRGHSDIFGSLIYTDESIQDFMEACAKRPEYNNTIFIITGDHRLIPIAQKDKLCRYHVPLLIYSPMLKKAEKFKSVSSHWDVTPSILSFLTHNYKFNPIKHSAWMGKGLDTVKAFRNVNTIPLMRYKGDVSDLVYKEYLLSNTDLFKINERFELSKVEDKDVFKSITDSLMAFKKMNAYVTQRKKIFPESLITTTSFRTTFTEEEVLILNQYTPGKNFDELFIIARDHAFEKDYKTAFLISDYILNEFPNYSEARVLKGRIYAWQGDYENAEKTLFNALERTPFSGDVYVALLDMYWWSNQDQKSKPVFIEALKNKVENPDISFKMAKAYSRINEAEEALKLIDSLIAIYPNTLEYAEFKSSFQ
ncbi:MAG: sulfatase-like hydrolase/transferase [Bizionia sp.]|nr:sulfatase-like hydrolase/transferase [Bizionia sp.]